MAGGKAYGSLVPISIEAGSGGGGGSNRFGGGGGGFLGMVADGPISISGIIKATSSDLGQVTGGTGSGGKAWIRSLVSVSVTGSITVSAGSASGGGGHGGTGYLRVDSYATPPAYAIKNSQTSMTLRLPDLDKVTESKIGTTMKLRVIALPDDTIMLALAAKGADINFPPFGKLKLDPGTMLIFGIKKATSGLDGIATFDVPIPNNTQLLGVMVHWQALNTITASKRPLLTNVLITTITN